MTVPDRPHGKAVNGEDAGPLDEVADLLIFGPLGLALEARRLWPDLADRGRGQVKLARATGRRAIARYMEWIDRRITTTRAEAESALRGLGLVPSTDGPDYEDHPGVTAFERADAALAPPREGVRPTVDVSELAVPDYDSLSASQVVPRLAGLSSEELELVRRYESEHRQRKTILNKVAQLQRES